MRKLEDKFKKKGYTFELGAKSGSGFVYKKTHPNWGDYHCFEVFKRKIAKAKSFTLEGRTVDSPEREIYPLDENFGSWAWTYNTFGEAMDKLAEF